LLVFLLFRGSREHSKKNRRWESPMYSSTPSKLQELQEKQLHASTISFGIAGTSRDTNWSSVASLLPASTGAPPPCAMPTARVRVLGAEHNACMHERGPRRLPHIVLQCSTTFPFPSTTSCKYGGRCAGDGGRATAAVPGDAGRHSHPSAKDVHFSGGGCAGGGGRRAGIKCAGGGRRA